MKKCKLVKRYQMTGKLIKNINKIDQMGIYKFIGEWGLRIQERRAQMVNLYNQLRFWWQPKIKL